MTQEPNLPKFKPPVFATIGMLIALFILMQLGQWQMDRLRWKNDLIGAIEAAYAQNPQETILDSVRLNSLHGKYPVFDYGTIRGTFIHQAEIAVGPRTHNGKPGYHIITPMRLRDQPDTIILINRGWVPLDQAERMRRPDTQNRASPVVIGTARAIPGPNPLTPANDPANDQWFSINPAQISAQFNLGPIMDHVMIYSESATPSFALPIPHETRWMPENNHLHYALFWFGMAFVMLVIYGIRFWGARSRLRRAQYAESDKSEH